MGTVSRLHGILAEIALRPAVFATMKAVVPGMATVLSTLIPKRDAVLARLEADNKMTIMQLVLDTERLAPAMDRAVPLSDLVDDCYRLGAFPALWAIEGIGHYHAESAQRRGEELVGLLTDPDLDQLPAGSLTMLHAGLGLSFGKLALRTLWSNRSAQRFRVAIELFEQLCRASSRDGYLGCALEALGLVALHVHGGGTVKSLGSQLENRGDDLEAWFWHGVGRASYFSPQNMIPGLSSPWPAVALISDLAAHEVAKKNLIAGLAWAVVMVNLRHPQIVEALLARHGKELASDDGFSHGVAASLIMRSDVTPDEESISSFCEYEPTLPGLGELWERIVQQPAEQALARNQPTFRRDGQLDQVFRYLPLPDLFSSVS